MFVCSIVHFWDITPYFGDIPEKANNIPKNERIECFLITLQLTRWFITMNIIINLIYCL